MEACNHNKLLCQTLLWFIISTNIFPLLEAFSLMLCWKIESLSLKTITSCSLPPGSHVGLSDIRRVFLADNYLLGLCALLIFKIKAGL